MNIIYRRLFTVSVSHQFRGGLCDDLSFVVPAATRAILADMRALVRERDGILHVLIEVDDAGTPLGECAGRHLLFGLAPRETWFAQYTAPFAIGPGETPLFGNFTSADALDASPRGVELAGRAPQIVPRLTTRPLDLRLASATGEQLAIGRLGAADATWPCPAGIASGELLLTEIGADGHAASRRIFIEPTLAGSGIWGILSLTASPAQVSDGASFTLALAARSETLRYYVLVKPTSEADFDSITVEDNGATDDARAPVTFNRVLPPFGAGRLSPALLDAGGTRRIVLFEARAPVARRARGPHGFELHRNGEVLIGNLPQPGAERSDAQFIVHLSKP